MDTWQIRHLQANLNNLVNYTDCNEEIKAALVTLSLCTEKEVQNLESIRRYQGRAKESLQLYTDFQTKNDGYANLTSLLFQFEQFQAAEILLNGFWQHGKTNAFEKCGIEIKLEKVLSTAVTSQGKSKTIQELVDQLELPDPDKFLKEAISEKDYFDMFVTQAKSFELVRDTIPKRHSSYIPRKLRAPDGTIYSEENFVQKFLTEAKPFICVSDILGSGRSFLLESLARKIAETCKNHNVVFMPFPEFVQNFDNTEMSPGVAAKELLKSVCPNSLSLALVPKMFESKKVTLTLLLDGYDELQSDLVLQAESFLTAIAKMALKVKVIISTKPKTAPKMDKATMECYTIVPFDNEDQVNLLSKHWKHALTLQDKTSVQTFAKVCLEKVRQAMLPQTEEFKIGIPLQCILVAKIFWKHAELYLKQGDRFLKSFYIDEQINTFTLYQRFFQQNRVSKDALDDMRIRNRKALFRLKALEQVFPNTAKVYAEYSKIYGCSTIKMVTMGNNQKVGHKIHRTFSEYLIAEMFTDLLTNRTLSEYKHLECQEYLIQNLVQDILTFSNVQLVRPDLDLYAPIKEIALFLDNIKLYTFKEMGIAYFLNQHLKSRRNTQYDHFIVNDFFASITPENFNQILQSCLSAGYTNILRFVFDLLTKMPENQVESYKAYFTAEASALETQTTLIRRATLLSAAAQHSHAMLEELFSVFETCFQTNLDEVHEVLPLWLRTPLHVATQKPDIKLVKHFMHKISLANRSLLYYCAHNSYHDSTETLKKRIAICRLLLGQNENLIHEVCYDANGEKYESPLVASEIHFELIQYLLQNGANVEATHARENVVHKAAKYMTPKDFHKFCRFLINDQTLAKVLSRNDTRWKSPMHVILEFGKNLDVETVQTLLWNLGTDVNETDENGNTLILSAVAGNQSIFVIMVMIDQGADIKRKNNDGQGLLHLACKNENLEIVQYFVSCDLSTSEADLFGQTPLLLASSNCEIKKFLLESESNAE